MRNVIGIVVFVTLLGCGPGPGELAASEFGVVAQPSNREPPPEVHCDYPRMACGGRCVDVERDNAHCGFCGESCDVASGVFCSHFQCVNIEDFGFTLHPRGPREYDPSTDAPRPTTR